MAQEEDIYTELDLDDANKLVAITAITPIHIHKIRTVFLPLHLTCPVYCYVRATFKVDNTILCFASTFMQRWLIARHPDFVDWYTDQGFLATHPPRDAAERRMLAWYLACINLAFKTYSDVTQHFSMTEACAGFLGIRVNSAQIFHIEMDILKNIGYQLIRPSPPSSIGFRDTK